MLTRRILVVASAFLAAASAFALPPSLPEQVSAAMARVYEVQQKHQDVLLARSGVVGVALAQSARGNPVLQIFTESADVRGLPSRLDGVDVEVVVTGRFVAEQTTPGGPAEYWPRPVPIGVSVAHPDVTAGTIGAQVFSGSGSTLKTYVLSNNHVLANQNLALIGDPVLQPGPYDGGTLSNSIGTLAAFKTIVISTTANNVIDAAIGRTTLANSDYRTPADGYGAPRKYTVTASVGMPVMKYGRTTRLTRGSVAAVNATVNVTYLAGTARFVQQIILQGANGSAFSGPGDSGSLVVVGSGSNARKVVGLVFCGSDTFTAANPIGSILSYFNVKISGDP